MTPPPQDRPGGAIGQPMNRVDGPAKVTGRATYAAEHPLPNLAHAVLVTSAIPHGRVRRIDTTAALAVPGVLTVLTHQSPGVTLRPVEAPYPKGPAGSGLLPLQSDEILQRGQVVAVVVADTLEQAEHAATLIEPEYEAAPFIGTLAESLTSDREDLRAPVEQADYTRGEPEQAYRAAEVQLDLTYTTPQEQHNPLELHGTLAVWESTTRLTVYEPSQWILAPQHTLAHHFGLDPEAVRVVSPYIGGGFGSKAATWAHLPLAALAARVVQRPVKLARSRAQEFAGVGYRPATKQRYQVGATQDGRVTSVLLHADSQAGMHNDFPEQVVNITRMLYDVPHMRTAQRLARTHAGEGIMMRAPGEASGSFALESAMDELAYAVGLDPLEVRLRNYAETEPESGLPFSSKLLRECYAQAAQRFGWARRTPTPGSMRDGDTLIGWGMASVTYPVYASAATARARLFADGRAEIEAGSQDIGTGTYSILTQIAADGLGVAPAQVRVFLGDTRYPKNAYSGGSRTAASVGDAVMAASLAVRQDLALLAVHDPASPLHGLTPEALEMRAGHLYAWADPARGEALSVILERAGRDHLEAYREVLPVGGERKNLQEMMSAKNASVPADAGGYARHSFGAIFVEVRVDPDFMTPRVSRMVGVYDVGRVLNHKTARSQLIGGMIWGVSMALHEQTDVDPTTGLVLNDNLAEYHVPVNADIGEVDVTLLDVPDPHASHLGVRGAGELGTVSTAAAVANAVYHATGKRIRDLPVSIDKLLSPEDR
ncbi:xanthine dehydrogenase family protein molybdopterin-binding subunit [Deinococcus sonorensis]|uniref:Xanthine dehydrogenase family protein molybdopterin-binding subunit n=2 Tax=Deinococcus sonorensis TaxID=309891 RepID=A0AAU7U7B3_9DEIO